MSRGSFMQNGCREGDLFCVFAWCLRNFQYSGRDKCAALEHVDSRMENMAVDMITIVIAVVCQLLKTL